MNLSNNRRLSKWWRQKWQTWMDKRLPASKRVTLSHKSIFILPSRFGVIWIGLVALLYMFGTNYQNNLVIGLSILLLSMFHTCIIYSYRNLAGLQLASLEPAQAYAGDTLSFPCQISSTQGAHEVVLSYPADTTTASDLTITGKIDTTAITALVSHQKVQRGKMNPGRLKVESYFPLGLCHAWSHVDLDTQLVVFPKPKSASLSLSAQDDDNSQENEMGRHVVGVDEFSGLKQYIKGESLKQVAWKQLAQGRGMLTKEFQQPLGKPIWLTLSSSHNTIYEQRLSEIAYEIERLHRENQQYGLQLNQQVIEPATGESHRLACLTLLALQPKQPQGESE